MIPAVLSNCSYVTALYCDCFGYAANGSTYDQNFGPKKTSLASCPTFETLQFGITLDKTFPVDEKKTTKIVS